VKITSPQDLFPENQSPLTSPSREEVLHHFQNFNPSRYAQTRNFLNGQVSRMSIHIKHGVIQNRELLKIIRDKFSFLESEKFIQELAWKDFWRSYAYHHPDQLWTDVEEYKTGFSPHDYLDDLPEDIALGKTPTQAINYFIQELTQILSHSFTRRRYRE
jgi:deoxyribodipyrimidine photo-lyase